MHAAFSEWLERRLPQSALSLPRDVTPLESSLKKELAAASLFRNAPEIDLDDPAVDQVEAVLKMHDEPAFDRVNLHLQIMPEMPDTLFVTAGVHITCGEDEAVYAYRFDSLSRTRIVENHPKQNWGTGMTKIELSGPDLLGRRLLLIRSFSIQCASSWMGMNYSVYRMSPLHPIESLFSSEHGFWLGNDGPEFILKPDELLIEFLDSSVDLGVHNRSHLLRYRFDEDVRRIQPIALQPQDFAEEWLTASWAEIQSSSTPGTQKWHVQLHADSGVGEYTNVVLCEAKPDRWSIGFLITDSKGKPLPEPLEVTFLVRDLGNFRFEMEAVSDSKFEGCPGEGSPSDKHPWLSVEQLKALP